MEDVAERAGVSLMTVSRAIRLPDTVAEQTRARIEKAMNELSYVGSAIAGQLATGRTRLVAVMLPDLRNSAFALAMQGLAEALGEEFELIVAGSHGSSRSETRVVRTLLGYQPAALVIHGGVHDPETRTLLASAGIPVVEIGAWVKSPVDRLVGYSNRAAGRAATEHLLERGHRHIAFVSQRRDINDRAEQRWRGYRDALKAAGLQPRPEFEIEAELGYAQGAQILGHLISRDRELDAVFFAGDVWAIGAVYECQRRKISVPDKIAIMGFDDQDAAGQMVPALSTVRVPRHEIGWEAGRLIKATLSGKPERRKRLDLGFKIVARETT